MYSGKNVGIINNHMISGTGNLFDEICKTDEAILMAKSPLDTCLILFKKSAIDAILNDESLGAKTQREEIINNTITLNIKNHQWEIPEDFIAYARLNHEILLLGMFETIELFAKEIYEADQEDFFGAD